MGKINEIKNREEEENSQRCDKRSTKEIRDYVDALILRIDDIPDNVRLILRKNRQSFIVSEAIKRRKTIKNLAKELGVDRSTIYCWKSEWWFMEFKYLKKMIALLEMNIENIESDVCGVKGQNKIPLIFKNKLPFEIPSDLIAHLQGDGSVKKRDCICNYSNTDPVLINSFIKTCQKIFVTQPHVYYAGKYSQVTLSAAFGKVLVSKFGTFGGKEFVIPKLRNKRQIKCYLRAIFDDEGSVVNDKNKYRYVSLRLCNENALKRIKKFLLLLGIDSHVYLYKGELRVSRRENIRLFSQVIGLTTPLKKKKLRILLKGYKTNQKS